MEYTELQVTSNFSFLRGASHPHELVEQAASLGYKEIAITDRNTLAGVVRAHSAAREHGLRIITGCRLDLLDGPSLLAYPTNKEAYSLLTNLLTFGNTRAEKGDCFLNKSEVYKHSKGIKFISIPPDTLNSAFVFDSSYINILAEYREAFGRDLYIGASKTYRGDDQKQLFRISELAGRFDLPMVATNDVHYHIPSRRQLQDIITCVREKCTIYNAGFRLHANAERFLKPANEMKRLFRQYPDAIKYTREITEACTFSLDELKYEYPEEIITEGRSPLSALTFLAWEGAKEHYGNEIPQKIIDNINHELHFIEEMNYASYFLTVYDIVRFARKQGILCQGRGSAANSTICFCLNITAVDPTKFDLLFERFISAARNEPPDIDVDFEHERREEVIQYIYNKYGRDRAAIVATVTQQHSKGAIRDVAKAMGLSTDMINRLAGSVGSLGEYPEQPIDTTRITEEGFDVRDKHLQKVLALTRQYVGFPRQLGQHTGGFVMTRGKLSDLVPILNARMENRTCIEWNKDDIDVLGWLKVDVLALGMLTCIRKAFDLAKKKYGLNLTLANIPPDDPAVYEMISKADTIGVFQIESRAQQSMLPRLKPRCFYDLVIEVAIVRPGPIQGDMVHPYLRRRNGEEPVEYPSKELEDILKRTLGVPLFQEQAMKIAIVAAGFTPTEADKLRKSMATFKSPGMVSHFKEKLIKGMVNNGYTAAYAERVFRQLEGFGSYGFPESHAASFAHLVYISSWIKCFYPDVFSCAILNSMPMGFYQPSQLVSDAQKHGVVARPVDINYSDWDNTLEERSGQYYALRLGFRHIRGLREKDIKMLLTGRTTYYSTINELRNLGLSDSTLEKLADADAFRSIGLDRRRALWEVSTKDTPTGIFSDQLNEEQEPVTLPEMSPFEHVLQDYHTTSLSIKQHPVHFVREKLRQLHIVSASDLVTMKDGDLVSVAGLVLVRQRPGTAKGVCFMTIEDETGTVNVVFFENLFKEFRKEITLSKLIMIAGKLQKEGEVIHVIAERCFNYSKLLADARKHHEANEENDKKRAPNNKIIPAPNEEAGQQLSMFPKGRNFR
ncbi:MULTISPECIES: error-prone DNA polymerase [Niastella]|uniref:Error-prone DNA polymerase n=1 Tax=Niastella soli TaxID=2821487 RepID=A0ABS3Z2H3_9BACT|nr:error-prone DNA polymerase [Niastella soli]MBO9204223.1 error-prone DNA polymerase [Niastella soli]